MIHELARKANDEGRVTTSVSFMLCCSVFYIHTSSRPVAGYFTFTAKCIQYTDTILYTATVLYTPAGVFRYNVHCTVYSTVHYVTVPPIPSHVDASSSAAVSIVRWTARPESFSTLYSTVQ